jgi:hypothetical protein
MYRDRTNYSNPDRDALFAIAHASTEILSVGETITESTPMSEVLQRVQSLPMYQVHNNPSSSTGTPDSPYPCQVYTYPIDIPLNYESYLVTLTNSVFVPCPPGNNPETFRHYEVCVIGWIKRVYSCFYLILSCVCRYWKLGGSH